MQRPEGMSIEEWIEDRLERGLVNELEKMERIVYLVGKMRHHKQQYPYPGAEEHKQRVKEIEEEIEEILEG